MSSHNYQRRGGGPRGPWRTNNRPSGQLSGDAPEWPTAGAHSSDADAWPTTGGNYSQDADAWPTADGSSSQGADAWPTADASSQDTQAWPTAGASTADANAWPTVGDSTPSASAASERGSAPQHTSSRTEVSTSTRGEPPKPSRHDAPAAAPSARPSSRPKMPSSNPSEAGPSNHPQTSRPSHSPNLSQQGAGESSSAAAPKKKKSRGGKRRRNRRQSFAAPSDQGDEEDRDEEQALLDVPEEQHSSQAFYRLGTQGAGSNTSIDSEALLDHREQPHSRPRRSSLHQNLLVQRAGANSPRHPGRATTAPIEMDGSRENRRQTALEADSDDEDATDRTPLISRSQRKQSGTNLGSYGGGYGSGARKTNRRTSTPSSTKSKKRPFIDRAISTQSLTEWDVNNPPSRPGSPRLGQDDQFDDPMMPELPRSPESRRNLMGEAVIDIDADDDMPKPDIDFHRRRTIADPEADVCLPFDNMTDVAEEDSVSVQQTVDGTHVHRRGRKRQWPDVDALEEFAQEEKEGWTTHDIKAKKVDEPVAIGGRLRPQKGTWRRDEEELPFRWTYFNEELDSSLRSHTISGLQQLGLSFRELFIPDRPEVDDDSSESEDEQIAATISAQERSSTPLNGQSRAGTRNSSMQFSGKRGMDKQPSSGERTGQSTPDKGKPQSDQQKPKKYGQRPVFWLDVLQPTYEEMRVISRAFGIHKLTAEDIMEQEAREKVELFRNYYFVNYRTFEQDDKSDDYLEPVNMYFVVFKGGIISFHFSQMPHPPNVRRRIRQLAEHQYTDSDWISYAIIDNITDAYAPLIEAIEKEVDDIDEEILTMHSREKSKNTSKDAGNELNEKQTPGEEEEEKQTSAERGRDMLIRVGECRKKVMGLYRLLGNKADVIKGLAKRYNDNVHPSAPRSDVGLYLGDIQDHIITMTGNLTHYESILSRAHSNYLAQINIIMNERSEQTGDALNKLTVLGTIVLPMNVITGMWGMNCLVPGQDVENLYWFYGLTAFLLMFGLSCFMIAKVIYKIV